MGERLGPEMPREAATAGRMAVDFLVDVGSLHSKFDLAHQ
jgi:hypothetical protein